MHLKTITSIFQVILLFENFTWQFVWFSQRDKFCPYRQSNWWTKYKSSSLYSSKTLQKTRIKPLKKLFCMESPYSNLITISLVRRESHQDDLCSIVSNPLTGSYILQTLQ
uniref:Putative ovule protein n=1 Tax=Solanum chacoense TaxID=4108 RepID=A0A0V0IVL7_SOLCH